MPSRKLTQRIADHDVEATALTGFVASDLGKGFSHFAQAKWAVHT
jgi:hypothetical protein